MFQEKDKSSFKYWFAHWCAYQMTALNLGVWKFKYLFHDIEKPFLELIWKDHKRVKEFHRKHNIHHAEYPGKRKKDYEAMIIDWECSRFTKSFRGFDAAHELENKLSKGTITKKEYHILREIVIKLGIDTLKGGTFID